MAALTNYKIADQIRGKPTNNQVEFLDLAPPEWSPNGYPVTTRVRQRLQQRTPENISKNVYDATIKLLVKCMAENVILDRTRQQAANSDFQKLMKILISSRPHRYIY